MLALLASVLLVFYVVVPGLVFQFFFSLFVPLRAFDRTRTQEIAYSVVVCVVPFLAALILVHHTFLGRWPFPFPDAWAQGAADYRTVLLTCFGDSFASSKDEFWSAAVRATQRLGRLLFWYVVLVSAEGLALGRLASKWGTIQPKLKAWPRTNRMLTGLLLRNISDWHVLLTDFLFPGTTMHVDVLTIEDRLYQGDVLTYTKGQGGSLLGIYLNNAQRYDRVGLLADRAEKKAKPPADYWKAIPGSRLFIFADKIATLNARPQTTLVAATELARKLDPNANVTVEVVGETLAPAPSAPSPENETAPGGPAPLSPPASPVGDPAPPGSSQAT